MKFKLALLISLACAGGQAVACYTVYDRNNNVVYNAQVPPVDMSQPLHETVQAAFPGGHLVFGDEPSCPRENTAARTGITSPSGRAPLLTEPSTAQSMGLKHTLLGNGIAMVRETPDTMRPGVVIAESGLPNASDTRAMGAGPSNVRAAPAYQARRGTTVITEMYNPPLTAVQNGAPGSR